MLEKEREKLNVIDDKIAELYNERMRISADIGKIKAENNLPLENLPREKEILNRVTKLVDEDKRVYTKKLFLEIFETGKAYQSGFTDSRSGIKSALKEALKSASPFPVSANVACQGVNGAFSGLAAEKLFELSDITYFKTFDGVFTAVEKGLCRYGILPIENSSVGSVNAVYDLMRKHNFYIVRSIKLRVQHNLLAKKGTDVSNIKEIYSHEQAISQCSELIKVFKNAEVKIVENTALASKFVAESERDDVACIASREAAGVYGLQVLKSNVQDKDNNYTRFIVISKKLEIFDNANRISVMVNLPHESGSLNRLLNKFSILGLNLTKLESRPMENSPFEFLFYFDFDADIRSTEVQNLIAELDNGDGGFTFLGSYREVI